MNRSLQYVGSLVDMVGMAEIILKEDGKAFDCSFAFISDTPYYGVPPLISLFAFFETDLASSLLTTSYIPY